MTTDKLTCPFCLGVAIQEVYGWSTVAEANHRSITDTRVITKCFLCSGSGDLLQGEMTEARARAILAAAREKCGGFINDGNGSHDKWIKVPSYSQFSGWESFGCTQFASHEYAFKNTADCESFLLFPRAVEALNFIFRK